MSEKNITEFKFGYKYFWISIKLILGYKSVQADNAIPFDTRRGVVQNTEGKVDTGLYASGWLGKSKTTIK